MTKLQFMKPFPDLSYLSALAIVTIVILLVYVAVQQNYRMTANDPQVQIARDAAERLEHNRPVTFFTPDTVNLSKSMAVFTAYYDAHQKPVASTGYLDGAIPKLPEGVLDYAKKHAEDRITWQPRKNVRLAAIVKYVSSPSVSYVVAGRSLQEVEVREGNLFKMVIIAWILCFAIILINRGWNYRNRNKT